MAVNHLSQTDANPLIRDRSHSLFRHEATMPLTGLMIGLYVLSMILTGPLGELSLHSYAGYLLATAFLLEVIRKRGGVFFPAPLMWFLVFICFCMFQMIWAPGYIDMALSLLQLFVASVIIVSYLVATGRIETIGYAFHAAVIGTFIYNIIFDPPLDDGRLGSTLLNANAYAYVLVFGVVFALRDLIVRRPEKPGPRRSVVLMYLAYICICIYVVIALTGSRKGTILIVGMSFSMVAYWSWHQPLKRRPLLIIILAVVFAGAGYGLYQTAGFSRLADLTNFITGNAVSDSGLTKRAALLDNALKLWSQRPFTGWGLDMFRDVSGQRTYAHNNYVELLANQGLIGLMVYLMTYVTAFVSLLRSVIRSTDALARGNGFWALVVLCATAVWDMGAVSYYDKLNWVVLSTVIAVAFLAQKATQSETRETAKGSL